jgi:hypothetical protein
VDPVNLETFIVDDDDVGPRSFFRPAAKNQEEGVWKEGAKLKTYTVIGIILIIIGIAALSYQGITYTTREKVVDIGPIHMTADKTKTIPLPPILGGLALVGGVVLLFLGSKKG